MTITIIKYNKSKCGEKKFVKLYLKKALYKTNLKSKNYPTIKKTPQYQYLVGFPFALIQAPRRDPTIKYKKKQTNTVLNVLDV